MATDALALLGRLGAVDLTLFNDVTDELLVTLFDLVKCSGLFLTSPYPLVGCTAGFPEVDKAGDFDDSFPETEEFGLLKGTITCRVPGCSGGLFSGPGSGGFEVFEDGGRI